MYSKHKYVIGGTFFIVFIVTYFLKIDFKVIASDCISIVSFALAIYAICISSLIGSPLLERLRSTQDNQVRHRTQLGVIKAYIKSAMSVSVLTLIIASVSKLQIGNTELLIIKNEFVLKNISAVDIEQLFSSVCLAFFALNFTFIILIFIFIISRQVQ